METMDLNAYQNELVREILATDNIEVLKVMRRAFHRAVGKVKKEAEAEIEFPMIASEDVVPYMRQSELEVDMGAPCRWTNRELKEQIKRSQEDIEKGRTYTSEEMKEYYLNF